MVYSNERKGNITILAMYVLIAILSVVLVIILLLRFLNPRTKGFSISPSKLWFVTFGNDATFGRARERIVREARDLGVFDEIVSYSERDFDEDFRYRHNSFITQNSRGYGYWIWKPYLVMRTLERMNEGDVLVYADAGCTLNREGLNRLKEYIRLAREHNSGSLAFVISGLPEKQWTKIDVLKEIFPSDIERIRETGQYISGIFLLRRSQRVMQLVREWWELSQNYHLIDDTPSLESESKEFKEHRHDQSLFSLLRKKHGSCTLEDESYFEGRWNSNRDKPIHATRRRD